MARQLGELVYQSNKDKLTVVGILTGGGLLAEEINEYLVEKGVESKTFNIKINVEKEKITINKELIAADGSNYIIIDDAIWSGKTKTIVMNEFKKLGISDFKLAVLLDPNNEADYSLFS